MRGELICLGEFLRGSALEHSESEKVHGELKVVQWVESLHLEQLPLQGPFPPSTASRW